MYWKKAKKNFDYIDELQFLLFEHSLHGKEDEDETNDTSAIAEKSSATGKTAGTISIEYFLT